MEKKPGDLVIAADAGIRLAERLGMEPDLTVGDFDSLGFVPQKGEVIRHPVRKDDTDSMLAARLGLARGYRRFAFYGCYGARPDHTFANIQTLAFVAERGGFATMCCGDFTAAVFKDGAISFPADTEGHFSVFSLTEEAEGVTVAGGLYEAEQEHLRYDFPLGQSNAFCGKEVRISVLRGTLLVIWQGGEERVRFPSDSVEK